MPGKAVAYLVATLDFQILAYILQIDWCSRQVQQHVQTRAKHLAAHVMFSCEVSSEVSCNG